MLAFWRSQMPSGIWQRLTGSQRTSFIVILFLLISIPAGVYLAQKTQIFEPKATSGPVNFYGTQVNFLKMFGQKSFGETSPNKVGPNSVFHASGVVVDRSSTPNKVYVVDTGNNRILGFNGIDGDGTKPADMVFGQPDFESGACNGDNNLGITKSPTASTLCLIGYPYITNLGEYWMRANFDVDSEGNLYIVDVWNNRVLKYNQPYSADKSNGKGDTVADFVWGQTDFNSNGINQGNSAYYDYSTTPKPNASSLWTSFGFGTTDHVAARGVSVDRQGNIWVADSFNHRVLRFPPNSKDADLVLGQSDFTSNVNGCSYGSTGNAINAPLDRMCTPTLTRVDPETGKLYVLDEHPLGFRARILVFNPPFTNGMFAEREVWPEDTELFRTPEKGGISFQSTGFIFNTFKEGAYANGKLWVNEHGLARTILINDDGDIIKLIGSRDKRTKGGEGNYPPECGFTSQDEAFNLWTPGGSLGIDSANNIYIADDEMGRIARYALPYETYTSGNTVCLPKTKGGLFKGTQPNINKWGTETLSSGVGLTVFGNQLIVQDAGFKVWNNYLDKSFGADSDIVVSAANTNRKLISDAIDNSNRLWTFNVHGKLTVYQLPFETGNENQPLVNSVRLYWEDTGEEINYNGIDNAIAFDKFNRKLYIVDGPSHRILRVSNYNVLFDGNQNNDKLLVDEVIGQIDKTTTGCNFYQKDAHFASQVTGPVTPDSLCKPHQVKFDKLGNLYVVENNYECQGNDRITLFMAEDLKNAQGLFPRLQAKKVFVGSLTGPGPCAYRTVGQPGSPVAIAFNSKNQMVVGNDGYYGTNEDRHLKQLWLYSDPLTRQTPDAYINLPMGASGELVFDSQDNLIVQDHTWSKVWIINLNRDPSWVKWLRTVPTPSPVPSPSPYPSPSPTSTPTLTPFPSPTLVPSPTSTPPPPSPLPSFTPSPTLIPKTTQTFYLSKGFNLIGVHVYRTKAYFAKDLLDDLNVSAVYRFNHNKNTWDYYTTAGEGNNFTINPGEGYFVLSSKDRVVTLFGPLVKASQIPINKGWSLISVLPATNFFDAAGVLDAMQKQGVDVSSIHRWDLEKTKYSKYGPGSIDNFTISVNEGYWIKNLGETKTFSLP